MEGDRKPFPFLQTHSDEDDGQFAPSSGGRVRWIAYSSDETGRREVFVRGFSGEAGKASEGLGTTMISNGGGRYPRWRADGRELYYLSDDGQMMAVDVSNGDVFRTGAPKALFRSQPLTAGAGFPYGITPRGDRFLLNYPVANERPAPVIVTLNWTRLLEKRK
jgi:Tol biopolymer transport system component